VGEVERSPDRESLRNNAICGAVANHDVDLECLAAERDLRNGPVVFGVRAEHRRRRLPTLWPRLLTARDDDAISARCQSERGRSLHAVANRYHALLSIRNPSDDADAVAHAHDSASDLEHASSENDALAAP
jgi:hypothetical protein